MNIRRMKGGTLLIAILFLLGGCASKYGPQTTQVMYYPQCYSSISELRETEGNTESSVATGALIGALLGAAGGLLVSGGKAEGAALGAVAGAGLGAVAGASSAQQEERKRLARYMHSLDGDIRGLNNLTAAGRLAIQCYDREFRSALSAFKAGRMNRRELDARYAEIRAGTAEATNVMGLAVNEAGQKEAQYQNALNDAAVKANRPVPVVKATPPPRKQTASRSGTQKTPVRSASATPPRVSGSGDDLDRLAQKTTTLAQSREELQDEVKEANSRQQSWAADLAAITS